MCDKFDKIQTEESYYACKWYDYFVKYNIPTINSVLIKGKTFEDISDDIEYKLFDYQFVRLCNASPKDYTKNCIFDDLESIKTALENSNRTFWMLPPHNNHGVHVLMRKVINIDIEMRCFFSEKLRAVSCNYYLKETERTILQDLVVGFFNKYSSILPYNQVCIDLGINNNMTNIFIIECNSFGINMNASAELFDWNEDYNLLYFSDTPVFKYKNEFEW